MNEPSHTGRPAGEQGAQGAHGAQGTHGAQGAHGAEGAHGEHFAHGEHGAHGQQVAGEGEPHRAPRHAGPPHPAEPPPGVWASGGTMFAGVLLLVTGVFGMLAGISGIGEDEVYGEVGDYVFRFDVNTWGWIHLILGIVVALTGIGILQGITWARVTGIVLAVLVMVANFMWLPYQPVWAVISIAIAAFVIWSLSTDLNRDPG